MRKFLSYVVLALLLTGCDEAVNHTDLCRQVYSVLCERSKECGAIESGAICQAWYYESCRVRRLNEGVVEPTEEAVQQCLATLEQLDCDDLELKALLKSGEGCAFLRQPDADAGAGDATPVPDGATDSSPADGATDAPVAQDAAQTGDVLDSTAD
jgi:hypothetical protein